MKLNKAKAAHYDAGPNMTPLVDVVMVILIFLMLAGSFSGAEHYLVSNLPVTKQGVGGDTSKASFDTTLDIRVDMPSPDRFTAVVGNQKANDATGLKQLLDSRYTQFKAAGSNIDKIQVVISPRGNVKYKFLINAYESAMEANFTSISFTTARP